MRSSSSGWEWGRSRLTTSSESTFPVTLKSLGGPDAPGVQSRFFARPFRRGPLPDMKTGERVRLTAEAIGSRAEPNRSIGGRHCRPVVSSADAYRAGEIVDRCIWASLVNEGCPRSRREFAASTRPTSTWSLFTDAVSPPGVAAPCSMPT